MFVKLNYCRRKSVSSSSFLSYSWGVNGNQTGLETLYNRIHYQRHSCIYNKDVWLWNSTAVTEFVKIVSGFTNAFTRLPWCCWLLGHLGYRHVSATKWCVTGWGALPRSRAVWQSLLGGGDKWVKTKTVSWTP